MSSVTPLCGGLRGYLRQGVTNIEAAQECVELLPFQMQVCLETFQTSGTGGAYWLLLLRGAHYTTHEILFLSTCERR
jgi:hypothetical protein